MLKDGSQPADPRLGRIYEEDWNSLNYPLSLRRDLTRDFTTYAPRSYTWSIDTQLDQGMEGACVGFAYAHDLLARPQVRRLIGNVPIDNRSAKELIYWPAQRVDEWAGGAYPGAVPFYEGTSILAGAKVVTSLGFYTEYRWALSLQEMVIGLGYDGPCIFGMNVYEGMMDTDANGFIHPRGEYLGGHAILVTGVKIKWKCWISSLFSKKWENVDLDASYATMKNSWGESWGQDGFCKISLRNLGLLLEQQGDACFPTRDLDAW